MGPLRVPDRRIFIIEPYYSFRNGRERADSRSSRQLKNDYLLSRILACVFRLLALNEILRNFNNRFVLFNLRHSFSPDFWPEVQLNVKRLAVHILKFLLTYLDEFHRSSLHAKKRGPETLSGAPISIGALISASLFLDETTRASLATPSFGPPGTVPKPLFPLHPITKLRDALPVV
jgi:hypothetical protein